MYTSPVRPSPPPWIPFPWLLLLLGHIPFSRCPVLGVYKRLDNKWFRSLGSPRPRCRQIQCLVRACFLAQGYIVSSYPHRSRAERWRRWEQQCLCWKILFTHSGPLLVCSLDIGVLKVSDRIPEGKRKRKHVLF